MGIQNKDVLGDGNQGRRSDVKIRVLLKVESSDDSLTYELNLKVVRIISYVDVASSYFLMILCMLSMLSEWRYFNIQWPHVNDPLSKLVLSGFPKRHGMLDLTLDCTTLNWAMAGQILVLFVYLLRITASYYLLHAMTPNLATATRLDLCKRWIYVGSFLISIYSSALIFSNLGICCQIVFLCELVYRMVALYQVMEVLAYFKLRLQALGILKRELQRKRMNSHMKKFEEAEAVKKIEGPSIIYSDAFSQA